MKNIRQHVFTLVLVFLSLMAGYITQPAPSQNHCIQDLTCWYRNMPGLVKIINPGTVLKYHDQMNDLINKADSISWFAEKHLYATFSKDEFIVSELIEILGEPEQVYIVQAFSSETNCAGLYIAYPNKRITAYIYPEAYFVGVKPTQSISSLDLISPELKLRWDGTDATDVSLHKWQGFIDYCKLHDLTLNLP